MALITCIECGKEISDQAESCPYCGYAMRRVRVEATVKKWKRRLIVWYLIIIAGIIFFFRGLSNGFDPLAMIFGFFLGVVGIIGLIVSGAVVWWKHG